MSPPGGAGGTYFEPREVDLGSLAAACIESGEGCVPLDADAIPGAFFDLSTRVAGELLHELGKYGIRLAVVMPDPAGYSAAFQGFVREAKRCGRASHDVSMNGKFVRMAEGGGS